MFMLLFNEWLFYTKMSNLHNVQLIFVSVQRTAQTSIRIFLKTRIIVDRVKFNSQDSGNHFRKLTFKNGY